MDLSVNFIAGQDKAVEKINRTRLRMYYKAVQGLIASLVSLSLPCYTQYQEKKAQSVGVANIHAGHPMTSARKFMPIQDTIRKVFPEIGSSAANERAQKMRESLIFIHDKIFHTLKAPILDISGIPTRISMSEFVD